MLTNQQ